jgi:type VI secretion system protein ImpM
MMANASGAFGKMPALGDFFRLRADPAFVSVWDTWLQEAMLVGRRALGPRWDDCYLTSPVWRFCLPKDVAGPTAIVGVLMPSIDRVGRQFPLTLMAGMPMAHGGGAFRGLFAQAKFLDALEALVLDSLDDSMTRDDLDARLSQIMPEDDPASGILSRSATGGLMMTGGSAHLLAADLATAALRPARVAVWSCSVDGIARFMTTAGLPIGPEAVALFDLDAACWAEPVA